MNRVVEECRCTGPHIAERRPKGCSAKPESDEDIRIHRTWEMPNRYTFHMRAVSRLLRVEMRGIWADPFSGRYSTAQIRNDADERNDAEYHMDGLDFLKSLPDASVDGVLFDPPYSVEQALRKYAAKRGGTAGRTEYQACCKDEIARVVRPGGKAICFGWNSAGIGKTRGFRLERVLLICHGACHHDTIVTVERRIETQCRPIRPLASRPG